MGDAGRGGKYLDLLERALPSIPPESRLAARFATMRCFHYGLTGHLNEAVRAATDARAIQERTRLQDEWNAVVPLILLRIYPCLEDYEAVERGRRPRCDSRSSPNRPGWCWCPVRGPWTAEARRLPEAADAARAAYADAQRLGFDQHFFAVDSLRALAGLALERRDLDRRAAHRAGAVA